VLVVAAIAVLVVLAVVRATYGDAPTPQRQRCEQARAAANAVPEREDTVDDEVEYRRLDARAEKICAEG
jgi:hypothetical protein